MNTRRKLPLAAALTAAVLILSVAPTVGRGQTGRRPSLIFTGIADPDHLDNYPLGFRAVIFVFDRGAWRLVHLPRQQYENASWQFAGRSKTKPEVWAVAQFGRGDIGPDLEIAHSLNDGRTWRHLRSLTKVSRHALFESFSMARNGRGSLTVRLQDSPEPEHRDGYYTYTTTDGGRTWSTKPVYSQTAPAPATDDSIERIPIRARFSGIPCSDQEAEGTAPN